MASLTFTATVFYTAISRSCFLYKVAEDAIKVNGIFRLAALLSMLLLLDIVFAYDSFPVVAQPGNLLVTAGGIVKLADYAVLVGLKVRTG